MLPAAVLHHLTVIGEAISRLSVELKERHPEVQWRQILAVRHRIVPAYFDLDWQILWDAAISDVPELRRQILEIVATEVSGIQSRQKPRTRVFCHGPNVDWNLKTQFLGVWPCGSPLFWTKDGLAPRHGFEPQT